MNAVKEPSCFTPFGLFIRERMRHDMCVTNLDYVFENFKNKPRQIMLLEEKTRGASIRHGQKKTFQLLSMLIGHGCKSFPGIEFWGFYELRFPVGESLPCGGTTLNGKPITVEQLIAHCNFEKKHCEGDIQAPAQWLVK